MAARRTKKANSKSIDSLTHEEARRTNLPSAEHQSLMRDEEQKPFRLAYERRNRDLDPQLVWRGKDQQDQSDLVVNVPPLYIQERIHPKALIDDLMRSAQKLSTRPLSTCHSARPVCRLQRPALRGRPDRVLPARRQLVQPHDPRRQPPGHGLARRARRPSRQGPVHLSRPALRHQVQLQLPVVHH